MAFAPALASAQSFDTDMSAIIDKISVSGTYSIVSEVKAYSKKGGALIHSMKASVASSKTATLTVIGEIEMLVTESQVITVDREEKLIEVRAVPKTTQGKPPRNSASTINLADLEKLAGEESGLEFKLMSTSGNIRTYTASNTKAGILAVTVRLDYVNKKLISYTAEMTDERGKPGQYTVVDYTQFSDEVNNPDLLKPARFVTGTGNSLRPAAAYKGYTLIQR